MLVWMVLPTTLAGDRVPQPHHAVAAGAGQQLAIGAERHPEHAPPGTGVQGRADAAAGGRVPQPHHAVGAGAGQQLAVVAERHRAHAVPGGGPATSVEGRDEVAGGQVPQPHRAVAVGAGQQLAIGAERHPVHAVPGGGVQGRADGAAGVRVPQPHRAVGVGGGQQLAAGAERHRPHPVRVGGQHALLLLLGQQGRDRGRGLAGGEDGPGGDGEPARGHAIGAVDVEAFGGELAGQGDGMLVAGAGGVVRGGGGVVRGDPGGGDGDQGEGEQASDHCLPPADAPPVSMAAGAQEVTLGLAERRVAGGIGADPGGGVGRRGQQAAGVEVGRIAGVAGPVGGGGVQPGAGNPVGVGVGEPGVAQQRPGGQQRLVADFHGAGGQGEQPFGGEGLHHCLHVLGLGGALAVDQLRPGHAVGGVHTLGAGGGQPDEDLPGCGLLGGCQGVVGALGAGGDGAFDAAGAFIVGQGEHLPGPAAPGLVQGVRQQRQHPRAESPGRSAAHLGEQHVDQVVIDARGCLLGRFGDRHPQLPPGHRGDQIPVLDRVGQLRIVRAPGLEVSTHTQHDQCRRGLIRPVSGRGGRV